MHFEARIKEKQIVCNVTPSENLIAPTLCFSLMAPATVAAGGTLTRSVGGYCEVNLPDLAKDKSHELILDPLDPRHAPTNRAWLPSGAYLRCKDKLIELPKLDTGVQSLGTFRFEPLDDIRLVPPPTRWDPLGGSMAFSGVKKMPTGWDALNALGLRCGLGPLEQADGIDLNLEADHGMPTDGYHIDISQQAIAVRYSTDAGLFYAGITLLILRKLHDGQLPLGRIEDAPRFDWRGQHLDCARHYYAPESIVELLDYMALVKMNRFHWHFADDEAFRLEVDCCPELWKGSACRGEGFAVPGVFGGGIKSCGTYSKKDVANIVAHAAAIGIEVLPEIEVPAHALAFNKTVPGLRDPHDTGTEVSVQGYEKNVVNPAIDKTWDVLNALVDEIGPLFPFNHLHLGCDELPPDTWLGSPAVDRLKEAEGLVTTDDVSGWTMAKLASRVSSNGQRPAAWEEAARGSNGGIGNNAILFSWTGQGPGIEAARAGYDVVMTPAQNAYLDMAHTASTSDWGATWAATISLEETVSWEPVPARFADIAERIIGVQGTFWSEFTTSDEQMQPMLAPRMLGVASMAWSQVPPDGPRIRSLAGHFQSIYQAMGWQWHRDA